MDEVQFQVRSTHRWKSIYNKETSKSFYFFYRSKLTFSNKSYIIYIDKNRRELSRSFCGECKLNFSINQKLYLNWQNWKNKSRSFRDEKPKRWIPDKSARVAGIFRVLLIYHCSHFPAYCNFSLRISTTRVCHRIVVSLFRPCECQNKLPSLIKYIFIIL